MRTQFGWRWSKLGLVVPAVCVAAALAIGGPVVAAPNKAERLAQAKKLVEQAYQYAAEGRFDEQTAVLEQAIELAPDYGPARWQMNYVEVDHKWVKSDEAVTASQNDRRMAQYDKKRNGSTPTVASQMELAAWCASHNLNDQAKAHLAQVLELAPDHAEARAKLGFVRMGQEWVQSNDIANERASSQAAIAALSAWRPKVEKIAKGLASTSLARRDLAISQLSEITDPAAIAALEEGLSQKSEDVAKELVRALSRFETPPASLALARIALTSPWKSVSQNAATQLQSRSMDDYVPALLSLMSSPLQSRTEVRAGTGGRIFYRHQFYREGSNKRELSSIDTQYRTDTHMNDANQQGAVQDIEAQVRQREQNVARENMRTAAANQRVIDVLSAATGQSLGNDPQSWWTWWNQYNEVFVAGEKPLQVSYTTNDVIVPTSTSSGGGVMDCLVAGTPCWTNRGVVAIEKVLPGDLVLSQDPNSGELAYKPVLDTTVRPASELVNIKLGETTLSTSGGHLMWVVGRGWVKSRELQTGWQLHTPQGQVEVVSVERGSSAPTYNLVVADFHTFFVSDKRVLNHDNTVRTPTDRKLPGLAPIAK